MKQEPGRRQPGIPVLQGGEDVNSPAALRDLMRRGNLTGAAVARLTGVNGRTVRRWLSGDSAIPFAAYALLNARVERAGFLGDLRDMQQHRVRLLERIAGLDAELAEARQELARTEKELAALNTPP